MKSLITALCSLWQADSLPKPAPTRPVATYEPRWATDALSAKCWQRAAAEYRGCGPNSACEHLAHLAGAYARVGED